MQRGAAEEVVEMVEALKTKIRAQESFLMQCAEGSEERAAIQRVIGELCAKLAEHEEC